MNKRTMMLGAMSVAMVASVVAPVTADAAVTKSKVTVKTVKVIKPESVQVTYVKNGKTVKKTLKPTTAVQHGSKVVKFKIDKKAYTFKLKTAYQYPAYVTYLKNLDELAIAVEAEDLEGIITAAEKIDKSVSSINEKYLTAAQIKSMEEDAATLEAIAQMLEEAAAAQ